MPSRFALLLLALTSASAQPAAPAKFDVASIRPAAVRLGQEGGHRSRIEHTPNSLTMWNVDLPACVQWAYDLPPFQVAADHAGATAYDILAKSGTTVSVATLRIMLQDLLATRFKLALHHETKQLPVFELTVAKGGPTLTPAAPDPSRPLVHAAESLPRVENDSFWFRGATLPEFARMLSQLRGIDLPVLDRTGIDGSFDIEMKSAPAAAREADTGALMSILQQQLGLKLVSAKAPFDVIVIDRAEKPSAN